MVPSPTRAAPLRVETLGRLWQRAWLDDVAAGGPLRFADWLDRLPRDLDRAARGTWRVDLLVAREVARRGAGQVVVEPEPGGRCLSRAAVLVVETVLADLTAGGVPIAESVELLDVAVEELAHAERWPVPAGMRSRLEALAGLIGDALAATGAQIRDVDRLLAIPPESPGEESTAVLDLDVAVAACLAVPRAVLASRAGESGLTGGHAAEVGTATLSTRHLVRRLVRRRGTR